MKRHTVRQRLAAFLLAALMSLSWLPPLPAFAENTPTETTSAAESDVSASASENEATPETSDPESNVVEDETSEGDTSLSKAAQKFVDSVNALDRDRILSAVNTWALASQAWQAEKDNPDLTAALETATAASDEAAAPVYAAEDLYIALTDEDRAQEAVQTAYSALAALFVTMQLTMENPTAPEEGGGNPPDEDEIATVLYGELPDAPTGSYMGSYGLPIATGDTKIGIGYWGNELLSADNQGRLDAQALNSDAMTIVVPRQDGESYAVVPIMVEVEYPANNSTSQVILPDNVTVLDYDGTEADADETSQILSGTYVETSAAATGLYVKAEEDFVAEFSYSAPDGSKLHKTLQVKLGESTANKASIQSNGSATYAATPTPPWTTGKITSIAYEGGTWLVWFNGVEAYCCSHGLSGQPNGCPTYSFSYVSKLEPGQYTPGAHYLNQINIWGGLNQLSLGLLSQKHNPDEYISSDFAAGSASTYSTAENDTLKAAYQYYDDTQLWIIKNYPDSAAAKAYLSAAAQLLGADNGVSTFASGKGYYTYIYSPPAGYAWQIIALIGPEITDEEGGTDIPDIPDAEYYSASWTAPAQSASGSFDLTFTVNTDKQQLETGEKVDGAKITVTPSKTSGSIDGGSWAMSPVGAQTITTSGHTMDDRYQANGGDGTVSWTVHYEVSKTSTSTLSGQEGPYSSQAEADAAAEAAKNAAISQLQNEAQGMVDAAIAAARAELASIVFQYDEIDVPYGFEEFSGAVGSHQTITVPADSSNDYVMKNDEWSLQVNLNKVDSETGEQIAGNALYEVYEWDTVTQQYMRRIANLRAMTTKGVASLIPFNTQEVLVPGGIYYGVNAISGNLIIGLRTVLINGNAMVIATSGGGKSLFVKQELLELFLRFLKAKFYIVDPENEYGPLVRELGGIVVDISVDSTTYFNPLDFTYDPSTKIQPHTAKAEFVLSLCEQIMGKDNIQAGDKSLIDRSLKHIYKPLIQSGYKAACPTLTDLYNDLKAQPHERAHEIALALELFATGSMNMFAQPTNVDMSNRLICFNIQSLGDQLKPVAMLSMLEYINTCVMSNERNDPKAATWVYFDEIYLLLRDKLSSQFLYTSWKRFRKYNAFATGITQNVQDCLANDTAYAMLANSEFVCMLRQTKDIDSVVELYGLSDPQKNYLKLAKPGQGILKLGNNLIPFVNDHPTNTKIYRLITTKPGEMEN